MAQRDRRRIEKALNKKGFKKEAGRRHDVFHLYVDGKQVGIHTILSRGSSYKSYGDSLLGMMKDELYLSTKDLLLLIDCPLDSDDYLSILREKKILDVTPLSR